jgi:uncharacterized protein (DUF952 family)
MYGPDFGKIDPNQKKHRDVQWETYRNDLLHLYAPLQLENMVHQDGYFLHDIPIALVNEKN